MSRWNRFLAPAEQRPRHETVGYPAELQIAIVTWIERTYHRRRRQRALGKLTPIEHEMIMTPANMPMKATLAVSALRMSISRRELEGTVVHSDRGSQFRSKKFVRVLANNGLFGSMGCVGACGDNTAMEYPTIRLEYTSLIAHR